MRRGFWVSPWLGLTPLTVGGCSGKTELPDPCKHTAVKGLCGQPLLKDEPGSFRGRTWCQRWKGTKA